MDQLHFCHDKESPAGLVFLKKNNSSQIPKPHSGKILKCRNREQSDQQHHSLSQQLYSRQQKGYTAGNKISEYLISTVLPDISGLKRAQWISMDIMHLSHHLFAFCHLDHAIGECTAGPSDWKQLLPPSCAYAQLPHITHVT